MDSTPALAAVFGQAGRAGGGRRANVHDVGNAPLILVRGDLGDAPVFGVVQEDALTGPASHPESMDTGLNVELHHLAEGVLVEMAIGRHRRDNCRENPSEFVHLALSFVFMAESCASHYVTDGCRCLCSDEPRRLLPAIQPIAPELQWSVISCQ